MSLALADCADARLDALRDFYGRVYRPDYVLARDEALLRWQFGAADADGRGPHVIVAERDGRIVGALGYIPADITVSGRVVRGAWTANWVVDRDQGAAVGPFLMRELTRRHEVTLVAGVSESARLLLPRLGWIDHGELPRYLRILDAASVRRLVGDRPMVPLPPAEELDAGATATDVRIGIVGRFGDGATHLWDALSGRDHAGTRRSASYLNWRYADHPAFLYRLHEARTSAGVCGLAVWRLEHVPDLDLAVARVIELVAHAGAVAPLLGSITAEARLARAALLDFFCSDARLAAPLLHAGWRREADLGGIRVPRLFSPVRHSHTGIRFMVHLHPHLRGERIAGWHVTRGDGDQDRPN